MIRVTLDQELLRHLDNTGNKLKIFTFNVPNLFRSLNDKSLEISTDLIELIDALLDFLDKNDLSNNQVTQKIFYYLKGLLLSQE